MIVQFQVILLARPVVNDGQCAWPPKWRWALLGCGCRNLLAFAVSSLHVHLRLMLLACIWWQTTSADKLTSFAVPTLGALHLQTGCILDRECTQVP